MKVADKHVGRTGGKHVSRSAGKNADMYAYKGMLAKMVHGWMGVYGRAISEQQVTIGVRRKRASASGDSPARGTTKDKRTPGTGARERERPTVEPPCERASASGKGGGTGRE